MSEAQNDQLNLEESEKAAKAKADAEKKAADKAAKRAGEAAKSKGEEKVEIKKSAVNMTLHSGTHLFIGKKASVSKKEHDELMKHYKPEQIDASLAKSKKAADDEE